MDHAKNAQPNTLLATDIVLPVQSTQHSTPKLLTVIASMDITRTNMVFAHRNAELMKFMILQLISVFASRDLVKSVEPAQFVLLVLNPLLMVQAAITAVLTKNFLMENAFVSQDMLSTLLLFALIALNSLMDSCLMVSVQFVQNQ